jgi:hypothetical protein
MNAPSLILTNPATNGSSLLNSRPMRFGRPAVTSWRLEACALRPAYRSARRGFFHVQGGIRAIPAPGHVRCQPIATQVVAQSPSTSHCDIQCSGLFDWRIFDGGRKRRNPDLARRARPRAAERIAVARQVHRSAWRKITAKIRTAKTTTKMIIMISGDIREV